MPKLSINQVLDAPTYFVDHFNGKYDTDKTIILRDESIVSDTDIMRQSLSRLPEDCKVLDMTNNDLVTIPPLETHKGIHTLLLGRNRIRTVDGKAFPRQIKNLSLVQNELKEFSDLEGLKFAPKTLENICLRGNDVCYLSGYRQYILKLCPQIRVLDFEKVTDKERSAEFPDEVLESEIKDSQTLVHKTDRRMRDKHMELLGTVVKKMDEETRNKIKRQLAEATTLDEIERLEGLLAGNIE